MTFMRARTLAFVVAACSPALLIALIGISGRFLVLPWQTPEYGPEAEKDLLAYAPAVAEVAKLTRDRDYRTPDRILNAAQIWIDGANSGKLKLVPPASSADYGGDGVRQEIENSKRNLLSFMVRTAEDYVDEKDYDQAAHVLTKTVELADVVKYNSPLNTSSSAAAQATCLEILTNIQPKISRFAAEEVASVVTTIDPRPGLVNHGYDRLVTLSRLNVSQTAIAPQTFAPWSSLVRANATDLLSYGKDNQSQSVILMNTFRQAYDRDVRCIQALNEATERYQDFVMPPPTTMTVVAYH